MGTMDILKTDIVETGNDDDMCLLCNSSDSCLEVQTGCNTGEHYLCQVCFEAVSKIGSSQNGCLLCSMQPVNDTLAITMADKEDLSDGMKSISCESQSASMSFCARHTWEVTYFFCMTCNKLVCDNCITGSCSTHKHVFIGHQPSTSVESGPRSDIMHMVEQARSRTKDLEVSMRKAEDATMHLRMQFSKARLDVEAAYLFFYDQLRERRVKLLNEIDSVFNVRWQRMSGELQEVRTHMENLQEFANVVDTVILGSTDCSAPDSVLLPIQAKLKSSLGQMLGYQPRLVDTASWVGELEFVANRQSMQVAVQNCLGYIRQGEVTENDSGVSSKPITDACADIIASEPGSDSSIQITDAQVENVSKTGFDKAVSNNHIIISGKDTISDRHQYDFWPNDLGDIMDLGNSVDLNATSSTVFSAVIGTEKKISIIDHAGSSSDTWSHSALSNSTAYPSNDSLSDSLPPVPVGLSTVKRQKMGYHCKFGEFGTRPGQFTEPSGITTNNVNDIIVADTNNHRLEVFDATGVFKYEILGRQAECELVYPNRLTVCRSSGDIVVTERSPTHQVQVFDRCGNFLRRFGGKVLQHPRGVAVDSHGRIVVVECRVMRVVIFDVGGAVINRFSLMGELEFPNGVAVDDNDHIFISDNRAHCVKVYNYTGAFVRTIGGAGITNYPVGVGVDRAGHVVVADNHNNFNVTVFDSDGTLIRALESRVKHAHCYDMALSGDGDIVVSSKDFRVYVYRYDAPIAVPNLAVGYPYM